jgi:hypothetical protein
MTKHFTEAIKEAVAGYLDRTHLPKTAYITNLLPNKEEGRTLLSHFNYVCFCVETRRMRPEALLLAHLHKYRRVDYDVVVGDIREGVLRRQFGYAALRVKTDQDVAELLDYISKNKAQINPNYPILLRLLGPNVVDVERPKDVKLLVGLSGDEAILEVTH